MAQRENIVGARWTVFWFDGGKFYVFEVYIIANSCLILDRSVVVSQRITFSKVLKS